MNHEAQSPAARDVGSFLRRRGTRVTLIVLAVLLVAYTALGFWLVPGLVRDQLQQFAREQYGRELTLGEVRFNPFTLVFEAHGLSFPDADGAQLLGFERLLLNLDFSSVWKWGASLSDVELDQPYVRVLLRPDGTLNLADLALPPTEKTPPEGDAPPRVEIGRLSVSTGRVVFEDRSRGTPFATELTPITFELRDFSTGGDSGNAYSLRGASVDGERFAWSGTFGLRPVTSGGKFEVAALQATTIGSYLRDALPFELTRGSLDLSGEYQFSAGEGGDLRLDVQRVALTDLGLRPRGREEDYVHVAALAVEGASVALGARRIDVTRVILDGGTLRVSRDAQGRLNLAELAPKGTADVSAGTAEPGTAAPAETATPAGPSTPGTPGAAWVIAAPDIAVNALRVDVRDELVEPTANFVLEPVALEVTGFTTEPGSRFDARLTAQGEATGDLQLQVNTRLDVADWAGRIELNGFDLVSLQPYLATYTQTTLKGGRLDSAFDLASDAAGVLTAKGDVTVHEVGLIDNALRQDLLKWNRLAVSGIDYRSRPARLAIARIDARRPYARLIIAQDQTLNISQLFTPPAGKTPEPVQAVRVGEERRATGGNPGAMRISIGTVKITDGSANFADYWIKPNYAVSLQELTGSIAGLSSDPESRARVDLKGRVDRYAPAEIAGEINLLSAALYTDVRLKFDGVEMTSVTPYSGHFAGYAIEKGKLSIDVSYLVENRNLTAKQKFVIDQLQLGERMESPDAVKLPLKLAVALLKDRNGVIDIDLPMSGSLDDPQFRMGPLIWKAFVGLLTKVATSPFTLLARLGGREDEINQIDFAPGSAELDAQGQERLAALVKALGERPSLELELPTVFSPEADGEALARARLEARLPAASPSADMEEAERFNALRKQHEKEFGSKAPLPPAAVAVLEQRRQKDAQPPYAEANEELVAALLARTPATEAELGELARARAEAIRTALLGSGDIDAKRVFVLGQKPVAAVDGKVRVELSLK